LLTCYPSPGKRKALRLCAAFAEGSGGRVAGLGEFRLSPGAAFFYGMTGHTLPLIERCRRGGRDWYYADNAYYIGRGAYFRVTRNAYQHDGGGAAGPERFARFGLSVAPWRRGGRHVLVTTQSELFYRLALGTTRQAWLADVVAQLRAATDRPIEVCHKPAPAVSGNAAAGSGFEQQLGDAHALVTHSSSTAAKALLEGVPVFCTGACMASAMARADLTRIEEPHYPDGRESWLWNLAANQWTCEEMADGTCWRQLSARTSAREAP
jgi:hypothetical protein